MLSLCLTILASRTSLPPYVDPVSNCSSMKSVYRQADCCGDDSKSFVPFRQDIPYVNAFKLQFNTKYEAQALADMNWFATGAQARPHSQMTAFLEFGKRQEIPNPTDANSNITVQSVAVVRMFNRYQDILGWEDLHSAPNTGYPPSMMAWTGNPDAAVDYSVTNNIPKDHLPLLKRLWKEYPLNCCGGKTLIQYYAEDNGVSTETIEQYWFPNFAADVPSDATLLDLLHWVRVNRLSSINGPAYFAET